MRQRRKYDAVLVAALPVPSDGLAKGKKLAAMGQAAATDLFHLRHTFGNPLLQIGQGSVDVLPLQEHLPKLLLDHRILNVQVVWVAGNRLRRIQRPPFSSNAASAVFMGAIFQLFTTVSYTAS